VTMPDRSTQEGRFVQRYRDLARRALQRIPTYPSSRYTGRGIVICAGGLNYFPCAWVALRMLRHLGCSLPIELWHLGRDEITSEMVDLVAPFGASCVDALALRAQLPVRRLGGWELKPYAILSTCFEEVLLLDADNVPIVDPEFLFEVSPYVETGAIFWPDYARFRPDRSVWEVFGVPYRDEPEFESGQVVVNKHRCWAPLQLAMHYNEHSEYYYRHVHGDKDTYHMAWRYLQQPYAMPPYAIRSLGGCVMCQHDFGGRIIFQHRNLAKWRLPFWRNRRVAGFVYEAECLDFLRDLSDKWSDGVVSLKPRTPSGMDAEERIRTIRRFVYRRVGHDQRPMEFLQDHTIGEGAARMEKQWSVVEKNDGSVVLRLEGDSGITCELQQDVGDVWRGRWDQFERMRIELIPSGSPWGTEA